MDLMGPMKVENLDGKKYAFVYVDDFWWYTWVKLFREKYDTFKVCMLCSMSTIRREQKKKQIVEFIVIMIENLRSQRSVSSVALKVLLMNS